MISLGLINPTSLFCAWLISCPEKLTVFARQPHRGHKRHKTHICIKIKSIQIRWSCFPRLSWEVQCSNVIKRSIFSKIFTKTSHSTPVRARYGVSFVDSASDWYSAWVPAIIFAKSYYNGPCYNSFRLYQVFSLNLYHINSLGPNDTIWWQRSRSILNKVMACCQTASGHYL